MLHHSVPSQLHDQISKQLAHKGKKKLSKSQLLMKESKERIRRVTVREVLKDKKQ
jgi:hypothetical protein